MAQPISKSPTAFASFSCRLTLPELQPAETLWALVDEPIANKPIATIEELEAKIAERSVALAEDPEQIKTRTGFRWWPKRIAPN